MPQALSTVNPPPGDAIEKNSGFTSLQQISYPSAPSISEATTVEDTIKAVPTNAIKSFMEVKLEDNGGCVPPVAAVEQFSGVSKTVGYASIQHKSRLVTTNQRRDQRLQAIGENFGDAFDSRILKCYGPEVLGLPSVFSFREEHQIRAVQTFQLSGVSVKGIKESKQVGRGSRPCCLEEQRTKTIRARAGIGVHMPIGQVNLIAIKRSI